MNVAKLFEVTLPNEPHQDLIEELEMLLNRAKSGELRGIAYAAIYPHDKTTAWCGADGTHDTIGMGIAMLNHRFFSRVLGIDE